jgi:GT2 family glycosyltransferase
MTSSGSASRKLGVVVIGRNEGARLVRCLQSLQGSGAAIVYVDSGSTDGSVAAARAIGADVVELDMNTTFTAARARNAGLAALGLGPDGPVAGAASCPEFIQFVDGDCEVQPGWLDAGIAFLTDHPDVAIVSGRLRERHPDASPYNALCDVEWDTPLGSATACGGIAMMRRDALAQTTLYDPSMIAGEEPELCVRIRRADWKIWRIADEMALHDAAMYRFGQFWKRMRRGGFAFAQWAAMYGRAPERLGVASLRRALAWGLLLPLFIGLAVLLWGPVALGLLAVYPVQVARLARRYGGSSSSWSRAFLLTIGKFAELQGVLEYHWRQWLGRPARLIEHK